MTDILGIDISVWSHFNLNVHCMAWGIK